MKHMPRSEPKCDVCGTTEGVEMFYDTLEVANEEDVVIYSECYGTLHCLCQKHTRERETLRKEHITINQLAQLLIHIDTEGMENGSRKRNWIKQLLLNCLQGLH